MEIIRANRLLTNRSFAEGEKFEQWVSKMGVQNGCPKWVSQMFKKSWRREGRGGEGGRVENCHSNDWLQSNIRSRCD
jgi:hypothetical protein